MWVRIVRMGQEKVVTWYVLITEGTYSVVMEDKMCRKIVPEIVFSGRISPWIKGSKIKRLNASEFEGLLFRPTKFYYQSGERCKPLSTDGCLFRGINNALLILYVDDIRLAAPTVAVTAGKTAETTRNCSTTLSSTRFHSVVRDRENRLIFPSQTNCVNKIGHPFNCFVRTIKSLADAARLHI